MKRDTIKMKKELQKRVRAWKSKHFTYNRDKENLRIENKQTGKGLLYHSPMQYRMA